nr:hypothetical protein [Tanacetum cinerariifolium]
MCGIKASAEQKKKLEEMMLELLDLCQVKEFYCVHDSIEDLIGMAMNTMLLSNYLKSQRLDKEKQEVKNIVEQVTKHRTLIAITPDLPTEEPEYSLSIGDEHLSTILETKLNKVIKSSVKNLVPIPSESEVTFDNEKIFSTKIDPHYFNVESNLLESLLNRYTLIYSSPKFDYLLEELSGELAHIDPIPSGIKEAEFDLEEEIHQLRSNDSLPLSENESYNFDHHDDLSFPRPPSEPPDVELVSKTALLCLTRRTMFHGRLVFSDMLRVRPNRKLIHNSIINGPYVRRMIPEPGDPNRKVPVNETFYMQTNDELTEKELKQIEADDQAIQTILLGLPEDIYAAVDSCETAQEIWLRIHQIMKGSDIGIQEKKAKLFNEWERFTSTDGESIESYYHRFLNLMNDLK